MGLRIFSNNKKCKLSFSIICASGIAGTIIDLDHYLPTIGFEGWGLAGRPLHLPLVIGVGVLLLYSCTRLRRLVIKLVLRKKNEQKMA